MGTAHVLEAARKQPSVEALVVITTDKVYRNAETGEAFAEDAPLGGHDPYSASKAAAEIVSASYRDSFLRAEGRPMATARAGNVIGGGDWSLDRIVPDCVRALVSGETVGVRNPASLRPWQHVLEPLSGYLWLAAMLLDGRKDVADAFNFGPDPQDTRTVGELVERFLAAWGAGTWEHPKLTGEPHEAGLLRLDITHAEQQLAWRPVWPFETAIERTAAWYRRHALDSADAASLVAEDIAAYVADAQRAGLPWAG
jgi:CDP-glucose 4,6-dehydratase